jgi:hypothetical protein
MLCKGAIRRFGQSMKLFAHVIAGHEQFRTHDQVKALPLDGAGQLAEPGLWRQPGTITLKNACLHGVHLSTMNIWRG